MSDEKRKRIVSVLKEIQDDLASDTERWEGAELTGRNVAEMLGEIRGTIHGLAGAVAALADLQEVGEPDCPDCGGQGVVQGEDRLLLCSRCDATGQLSSTSKEQEENE